MPKYCPWKQSLAGFLSLSVIFFTTGVATAQIIPDSTLGSSKSIVNPVNSLLDKIDGGAVRGNNLFHSFQDFSIGLGHSVYFTNPTGITNIFSRVTGSNPSQILGTLGVTGSANLFFLNPNGIIFGANAKLDISGSFIASTANSVVFPDGTLFSASHPQNAPLLAVNVPKPVGLQFEGQQPGVIISAGDLAVGQNLSLVGGTIISSGKLSAPNGELALVTVSGVQSDGSIPVVNLGGAGEFINSEVKPPSTSGNNQPITSTVPFTQLLADPSLSNVVTINSNGTATLSGINIAIAPGDIVAKNVNSQTAILSAVNNLTLVESTLQTTGDLQLLAQNYVIAGDIVQPFIAEALGNLLVQGNQGVGIYALNNSNSGFFSGKDMVLRSPDTVVGDAHFFSNGSFRIEKLDGSLGNLYSAYNSTINANGDVSFANYLGASLQILAGGSVNIPGNITIIGVDTANSLTENVTLSDGKTVIPINGSTQPTLDIRAGTTAVGIPEMQGNTTGFTTTANNGTTGTSADISIGNIINNGGVVFLTNQYAPKISLPGGAINVGGINTSVVNSSNGGTITIDARDNIAFTGDLFSFSAPSTGNAGNGGTINLLAGGNINTAGIYSYSNSATGNAGNGGAIYIASSSNINTTKINSSSNFATGNAGYSGAIILLADDNIIATDIKSLSINGGVINLLEANGDVSFNSYTGSSLHVFAGGSVNIPGSILIVGVDRATSFAENVTLSDGKTVIPINGSTQPTLDIRAGISGSTTANNRNTGTSTDINIGNIINHDGVVFLTNQYAPKASLPGGAINVGGIDTSNGFYTADNLNGGNVTIDARSNIVLTGSLLSASNGNYMGNGGAINLLAGGNITATDISSTSFANSNAGNGGAINLLAGGNITATDIGSTSFANSNAGNGGAINLLAGGNITATDISSFSFANSNAGNGGAINLLAGGNITATNIDSTSQYTKLENRAGITFIHGNGDISFTNYTGGSLQILAGGSVNIPGSVVITGVDTTNSIAENITLSDGKTVIPINGSTQPTLDIRAGTTAIASGVQGGTTGFTTTAHNGTTGTSADINIGSIFNNGGVVFLTNQYAPKISLPGGTINVGDIETFTTADSNSNGGAVTIDARSNIIIPNGIDCSSINGNGGAVNLFAGGNIDALGILSYALPNNNNAGNGGAVNLSARGNIISTDINSSSFSNNSNAGNGGAVNLSAGDNIRTSIDSFSYSDYGNAGNGGAITLGSNTGNINTSNSFNSFSYSDYGNAGNGGAITLSAKNGDVIGGSLNSFAIAKTGNAQIGGNVTIEAKNNITDINILSISSSSQSGKVNFTGFSDLSVINDSIITSKQVTVKLPFPTNEESITLAIGGIGQSGNAIITSSGNLTFNNSLIKSDAIGINPAGNITIGSSGLITFNNSQITSNTINLGQGGSINIQAGEGLFLDSQSSISTQSSNNGAAGSINIQSPILTLTGSNLSASNKDGLGGSITVTANNINASNGAQLQTSTIGSSKAGDIILNVLDNITLTGKNTGLFANTAVGSTGNGGVISIDPNIVNILDGAQIAVNSQGTGIGGSIQLTANTLTLNQGKISAETLSNTGGNINLSVRDLLLMRNGSNISTTAGNDQFGGNGGNININAANGFIVAFPTENSDITANAYKGNGGNVQISTQGIFGLEYRPVLTPDSDITASSTFGVNGQVTIATPGIDPNRGLNALPEKPVKAQIVIGCQNGGTQGSIAFSNIGRAGLPSKPDEPLVEDVMFADWLDPDFSHSIDSQVNLTTLNQPWTANQSLISIPSCYVK